METIECALKSECEHHKYDQVLTPPSTVEKP